MFNEQLEIKGDAFAEYQESQEADECLRDQPHHETTDDDIDAHFRQWRAEQ